jgi:cytochrome c oxidase subunit 2
MDMVPGMITYYWVTPIRTGNFDIMCFELCGTGHYSMRGNVVVETKEAYEGWMNEQETFAQSMAKIQPAEEENGKLALNKATSVMTGVKTNW